MPVEADNIAGLAANKGNIFYTVAGAAYYGRTSERRAALKVFSFADRKETVLSEGLTGYAMSQDGVKLLVREAAGFVLTDAKAGGTKKNVATTGLYVDRTPREEWTQIFDESGVATATSSTSTTCMVRTGTRCATSTGRCCNTSHTGPI